MFQGDNNHNSIISKSMIQQHNHPKSVGELTCDMLIFSVEKYLIILIVYSDSEREDLRTAVYGQSSMGDAGNSIASRILERNGIKDEPLFPVQEGVCF